jgi:hypothetical protein
MYKKSTLLIIFLIFIGLFTGVYYNKTYLQEGSLNIDIQERLKANPVNNLISHYEILEQKDFKYVRIILYRYIANNNNLIGCTIYERTPNQRFKFLKSNQASMDMDITMTHLKDKENSEVYYLIHYGYVGDTGPNKYEITLENKSFIKEYSRNKSFIETYSMKNGKISIRPIYDKDKEVAQ